MKHPRRFGGRPATRFFRLPLRLGYTNFAFLLTSVIIATIYFYYRLTSLQDSSKDCSWINNPPFVCAHGGDSSGAPANTVKAYQLAMNLQVDCIEIDASRTRDGVLVALHDRDLQRISGVAGERVGDLTYQQIVELDAGRGFSAEFANERVPTLEGALQFVHGHVKQVIVDVKVGPPLFEMDLAADVLAVVEKVSCKSCLVWSKVDTMVMDYEQLSPERLSGYIVLNDSVTGKVTELLRLAESEVVGVFHGLVNEQLVVTAHRAQKQVYVWTVDEPKTMERILRHSVDCIITSKPSSLQQVMRLQKVQCANAGQYSSVNLRAVT